MIAAHDLAALRCVAGAFWLGAAAWGLSAWMSWRERKEAERAMRRAREAQELAEHSKRAAEAAWARFSRVGPSPVVTEVVHLYRQ